MIPIEVYSIAVRAFGLLSDSVATAYSHHFENHDNLINNLRKQSIFPILTTKKMNTLVNRSTHRQAMCSNVYRYHLDIVPTMCPPLMLTWRS
jgi:hypothetical protein